MKDIIKTIQSLIPFLEAYPIWMKSLVGIWIVFTALILIGLLFTRTKDSSSDDSVTPSENQKEISGNQPQLSLQVLAKPFLRQSVSDQSNIRYSYEICIKNSGLHPASGLKYTKVNQSLFVGSELIATSDKSEPSHQPPAKLVNGEKFYQIFSMGNETLSNEQSSNLVEKYNAGEVSIILELELQFEDPVTGLKHVFSERNRFRIDRVEIL